MPHSGRSKLLLRITPKSLVALHSKKPCPDQAPTFVQCPCAVLQAGAALYVLLHKGVALEVLKLLVG